MEYFGGLGQFRDVGKTISYPILIGLKKEGKISMLDGSNRLMAQVMRGADSVEMYIGTIKHEDKCFVGDSLILFMANLYQKGDLKLKDSVFEVMKYLIQNSTDGSNATKEYWIKHSKNKELNIIGEKLINNY